MGSVVVSGAPIYVAHGQPPVAALGIRDGRIVAAGSLREVRAVMPPAARQLAAATGAIMPAFVDAHQHAFLVAVDPYTDVLHRTCWTIPELLGRVSALLPRGGPDLEHAWLRFHGYAPLALAERRSPTAAELDTVCPDRPLQVLSRTYHESAVNTAGLEALRIGRTTPDPPGGQILRDRRGHATGVLLEAASFAAERASRPLDPDGAWRVRLAEYGHRLLAHGIARIGDAAVPVEVAAQAVAVLEEVGVTSHPLLIGDRIDTPGFVTGGTAKVLADGGEYCDLCMSPRQVGKVMRASARASFGSERATARALGRRSGMPRRRADRLWHTGFRFPEGDAFSEVLARAADEGSALAVHAAGNGAVEAVLSARTAERKLADQVRLRIEHAMVVDQELAARLGADGLPVVSQPGFLWAFGHELTVVPVPAPLQLMPFRTMTEAGIPLVFSSDYPATDLNPWQTVASAVLRRDHTGAVIHPEQALSVAEALIAHTSASAVVMGDPTVGKLSVGSRATMIWCDADPYRVSPEDLAMITTLATWVDGELRFGREPAEGS